MHLLETMNIEALCAAPPEAFAHSPSQMLLSCPIVPVSHCELHKDGSGGGGGVARRARAARARKAKSCATSSATPCAASFTCPSFTCNLKAGVGGLVSGSPRAEEFLFGALAPPLELKMARATMNTFTLPSSAAPGFRR